MRHQLHRLPGTQFVSSAGIFAGSQPVPYPWFPSTPALMSRYLCNCCTTPLPDPAVKVADLQPEYIPLHPDTHLADLSRVDPAAAARCSCLLLNYPNNPTGAVADEAFWQGVLRFCEQHDLLLIHDNPYVCQVWWHSCFGFADDV
jgi:hypothetical protein